VARRPVFDSQQEGRYFSPLNVQTNLRHIQPSINEYGGGFTIGLKRLVREAERSPQSRV
jgi:hypothetical protein